MAALVLANLCRGCQRCVRSCPHGALHMEAGFAVVTSEQCIECEQCLDACMHGAITMSDTAENVQAK